MKKRFIAALTAVMMLITAAPSLAKTVEVVPSEYTFGDSPQAAELFTGTASGNAAWSGESVDTYVSFDNTAMTIASERRAAFVSLDNEMTSNYFDMTSSVGVTVSNDRDSASYHTGFVFGANESGYYEVLFNAAGEAAIARSDELHTTSADVLASNPLGDLMALDGTPSNIKVSVDKQKITVYVNDTAAVEYDAGAEIEKGFFGFITTRDMSAVYSDFKLTLYEERITYEESDYLIPEFSASSDGTRAAVSWINPDVEEITGIRLLTDSGEEITEYDGEISTAAAASNYITTAQLPHGRDVGIMIEISFASHDPVRSEASIVNIPYTDDDYKITDFSASAQANGARLSWRNPAAEGITAITITDDKGNTYDISVSLESGAQNDITVSGLSGGETYTFSVTAEFEDGRTDTASGAVTAILVEEAGYQPKNMLVYESFTRLGISWLNPEKELASIEVLDYNTGAGAVFEDEISLEPGAANNVLVEDLPSDTPQNFRIIFRFADGHSAVEYVAGGLAYGKGTYYDYEQVTLTKVADWDIFCNIPTATYGSVPAIISVDRNEKAEGNNSLKFTGAYAKPYDNLFYQLRIKPFNSYDPSKTYRVSMKIKYENAQNSVILTYANKAMNSYADGTSDPRYGVGTNLTPKESSDGWETVSFLMEPETSDGQPRLSGQEFAVRILGTAEAFWIDDMEMVPVDEEGNVIGENILPNPGLEADDNTPSGNVRVDTQNSALKNGTAALVWENPDDAQLKNILIYREQDGELYECAVLSSSTESIELKNIPDTGETVRFVIKTADQSDNISSGASIELAPSFDDCVFGAVKFTSGGTELTSVPSGFEGTVTASASVSNYALDDFSGCIAAAAYCDGVLKSVSVSPAVWFRRGAGETAVSASVTITSGGSWTVKAFLLDDIVNMKLLTDEGEI